MKLITRVIALAVLSAVCFTGCTSDVVHSNAVNCRELKAEGYSNIQVRANPHLEKLDRDKDGVACES